MSVQQRSSLCFGLWYDFRCPPQWKHPYNQVYSEIFDQIVWAEQAGCDDGRLPEHHCIENGYSPSLPPIAAAITAQTTKIHIGTSKVIPAFH